MYENKNFNEVIDVFNSNEQSGLSESEAKSRLEKNGKNKLAEGKKTPNLLILRRCPFPTIINIIYFLWLNAIAILM